MSIADLWDWITRCFGWRERVLARWEEAVAW